jgi:hypothetical protein
MDASHGVCPSGSDHSPRDASVVCSSALRVRRLLRKVARWSPGPIPPAFDWPSRACTYQAAVRRTCGPSPATARALDGPGRATSHVPGGCGRFPRVVRRGKRPHAVGSATISVLRARAPAPSPVAGCHGGLRNPPPPSPRAAARRTTTALRTDRDRPSHRATRSSRPQRQTDNRGVVVASRGVQPGENATTRHGPGVVAGVARPSGARHTGDVTYRAAQRRAASPWNTPWTPWTPWPSPRRSR